MGAQLNTYQALGGFILPGIFLIGITGISVKVQTKTGINSRWCNYIFIWIHNSIWLNPI